MTDSRDIERRDDDRTGDDRRRAERREPDRAGAPRDRKRATARPILTSLQIETPLEEFRRHFAKKQRSFEGTGDGKPTEIYRRAFELAEHLIRKQGGGDTPC